MHCKKLGKIELDELARVKGEIAATEETYELASSYYLEYKNYSSLSSFPQDKLQLVFKGCLYFAEKSQVITNCNGEVIRMPSMAMKNLLQKYKVDDVITLIKELKSMECMEEQVKTSASNLIKEISFFISMYTKFLKNLKILGIDESQKDEDRDYIRKYISFLWLLYIESKNSIFSKDLDLVEHTCLMAQIFCFVIIYSWEFFKPPLFLKEGQSLADKTSKEVSIAIKDQILSLFHIKNLEFFRNIAEKFQNLFKKLIMEKVIKMSDSKTDFMSPALLPYNYRKLEIYYGKKSTMLSEIDERVFYREKTGNLTPARFTPFARQGYVNRGKNQPVKLGGNFNFINPQQQPPTRQYYSSCRLLNFDNMEKYFEKEEMSKPAAIQEARIPQSVLQSPSTAKNHLITYSPYTTGMTMFNYLSHYELKYKQSQHNLPVRKFDDQIYYQIDRITTLAKKADKKTRELKVKSIYSYYKVALQNYLTAHPEDENNTDLATAFAALSLEINFFVSNTSFSMEEIQHELRLDSIQEWKTCNFMLKFDRTTPNALKMHLMDIEVKLISHRIWENPVVITQLAAYFKNKHDKTTAPFIEKFFCRLLHQTAFQIVQMGKAFKLSEATNQKVFESMKHLFTSHIDMLEGRSLDLLLLCNFYAVCRIDQYALKFSDIIDKYSEINEGSYHSEYIHKIKVPQQNAPIGLIKYYNQYFIKEMRTFYQAQKQNLNTSHEHKGSSTSRKTPNSTLANKSASNLLMSPLKDVIPNSSNLNSKFKKNANNSNQADLLYAYNASPLLKYDSSSFKGQLHSKKALKFEEDDDTLIKKCAQEKKQQKESHPMGSQAMNKNFSNWQNSIKQHSETVHVSYITPGRMKMNQYNANNQPEEQTNNKMFSGASGHHKNIHYNKYEHH